MNEIQDLLDDAYECNNRRMIRDNMVVNITMVPPEDKASSDDDSDDSDDPTGDISRISGRLLELGSEV